jgi:hypothetical protein
MGEGGWKKCNVTIFIIFDLYQAVCSGFLVSANTLSPPFFCNPVNPWQLGNAAQIKFKSGLQLQLRMSQHFGFCLL